MSAASDTTLLLQAARAGDAEAHAALWPRLHGELRRIAHARLLKHRPGDTLNTTALFHEAYEKLARSNSAYNDRKHFFRVAARAMREVLVTHARRHGRQKRGGGLRPLSLDESLVVPPEQSGRLLALDEALTHPSALDTRQADSRRPSVPGLPVSARGHLALLPLLSPRVLAAGAPHFWRTRRALAW